MSNNNNNNNEHKIDPEVLSERTEILHFLYFFVNNKFHNLFFINFCSKNSFCYITEIYHHHHLNFVLFIFYFPRSIFLKLNKKTNKVLF